MATRVEHSWVVDMERRVEAVDKSSEEKLWNKPSVYRVPDFARALNAKAFTPQVVSFGPYHHNEDHLREAEEHKHRATAHLLKRSGKPLAEFVSKMEGVVERLLDSYDALDREWRRCNRDEFLKLMIVDGCFMLEVLRLDNPSKPTDYACNDPFFSRHGSFHIMPYIRRDMLMIENQLPLLVLKKLLQVEACNEPPPSADDINKLVLRFVTDNADVKTREGLGLHALDLYHQSLLQGSTPTRSSPLSQARDPGMTVRSAVALREAGVQFKRSESSSLRDIKFGPNGVLQLPRLVVDDATECTFLNLVAFEHRHMGAGNEVTSFLSFIDEIIDTAKDVSLLHDKGIIQNKLGSDKAVAALFNSLCKDFTLDPNNGLGQVQGDVRSYCQRWNKWRASLKHTYFRNPWSSLSLAGAVLVILLTIGQTVYSILGFYNQATASAASRV